MTSVIPHGMLLRMPKTKAPEFTPTSASLGPLALTAREVLPPLPLAAGVLAVGVSLIGLAVARPKNLPPVVQRTADVVAASALLHPLEVVGVTRALRGRALTPAARRKVQVSVLTFGAFSWLPVFRAARRAPKV